MAFIKGSVGKNGQNDQADVEIIVELLFLAHANKSFLTQPTLDNLEKSGRLFSIGVEQAIGEFVRYATNFYLILKVPKLKRIRLNRFLIHPDDDNYRILLACAICGNRKPIKEDFDQNPLLKKAFHSVISYLTFKQAIASGSFCNGAVNRESTATKLDGATVDLLRKNLEKLYGNQTFKIFIEVVISSLPATWVFGNLRAEKYTGTILENFDRVRNAKGYWIDFLKDAQAIYHRGKITFNHHDFRPASTKPITFTYNNKDGTTETSSVASKATNSQATEALATTFTLAHELIHAYWSPIDVAYKMDHDTMDQAAKSAVGKLGLKLNIPYETFYEKHSANYFTAVLGEICGNIRL